ncbi:hypothetical protein BN2476_930033 [Paraburkholderia piptadeniae]|uniref:Uncharacterized protein n=1 Tax=Paraburkholderia piptadeniae TaxID=1701573 RepID=A0A1N7STL0_9BURK|nr:hypothetical protein BN2476_930033 [Paraburkholderia piptadeniae]
MHEDQQGVQCGRPGREAWSAAPLALHFWRDAQRQRSVMYQRLAGARLYRKLTVSEIQQSFGHKCPPSLKIGGTRAVTRSRQ